MAALFFCLLSLGQADPAPPSGLTLRHDGHYLFIQGKQIPGGAIRINYLEAYCRAGSTDADWVTHTVVRHTSQQLFLSDNGKVLRLRDTLADGVTVEHTIIAGADQVAFDLVAISTITCPSVFSSSMARQPACPPATGPQRPAIPPARSGAPGMCPAPM